MDPGKEEEGGERGTGRKQSRGGEVGRQVCIGALHEGGGHVSLRLRCTGLWVGKGEYTAGVQRAIGTW